MCMQTRLSYLFHRIDFILNNRGWFEINEVKHLINYPFVNEPKQRKEIRKKL